MNGILGSLPMQKLGKGHVINDLTIFDLRIQTKSDLLLHLGEIDRERSQENFKETQSQV